MTATLLRPTDTDFRHVDFEDELVLEIRLAELVISLTACSARRAFRLVRQRNNETPLERLARALAATLNAPAAKTSEDEG